MTLAIAVLVFVTLQRLAELVWARRNTALLLQKGAREFGAEHYPLIVILHAAWLAGLWWFGWNREVDAIWLTLFFILQGLSLWVLATLGERWTTRIIVMPGAPLVREGPYRFCPHPNYIVVAGEIFVLPAAFGLWLFALVFSALNAVVLFIRMRAESAALRA